MKKLLFIGGDNKHGVGRHLLKKTKKDYSVLRVGKSLFYSAKFAEKIIQFKPDYILITSTSYYKEDITKVDYENIENVIRSKLQPLYQIAKLVNHIPVESVVVISGIVSELVLDTYSALAVSCSSVEKLIEYLASHFMGKTRFNYISPWRIFIDEKEDNKVDINDIYSTIVFLLENKSINGTGIAIDGGYSLNVKKDINNVS
jgi:hypothetical protein